MKRTQIQLDEHTFETLRHRAFREKRSVASIIREILRTQTSIRPSAKRRYSATDFSFIGAGRSRGKGAGHISERHDEEFARAIFAK